MLHSKGDVAPSRRSARAHTVAIASTLTQANLYLSLFAVPIFVGLQEYVNGQLKNKYGDVFIRGNNGRWLDCKLAWGLCSMSGVEKPCRGHQSTPHQPLRSC
jgi:hypothetical protein